MNIALLKGLNLPASQGIGTDVQETQARFIKSAAMQQPTAPPRQPAPVKRGEPTMGMEQPSQPQAAKKVTARQSARMQKQQQQKQACTSQQAAIALRQCVLRHPQLQIAIQLRQCVLQ